ncbi:hypothetical protein DFJ74DRAFT_258280 [Hyaloraphidium curvatum]|nr:hypothetical protein DFJ74DRAFT_258280 [Hyaloraphidium curvatum]
MSSKTSSSASTSASKAASETKAETKDASETTSEIKAEPKAETKTAESKTATVAKVSLDDLDAADAAAAEAREEKLDAAALAAENKKLKAQLAELQSKYDQLGEEVKAMFSKPELVAALQGSLGPAIAGGRSIAEAEPLTDSAGVLGADSSEGFQPLGGATLDTSNAAAAEEFVGVPMETEDSAAASDPNAICVEETTNGLYPDLGICGYPKDNHPFRHPFKPGKLPAGYKGKPAKKI